MSVKIRMARVGRHMNPFYRIVAADSRFARDGRYIEQLGTFDPSKPEESAIINEPLVLKWLGLGAQPSETVRTLLSRKGIMTKFAESKKVSKKEGK